MRKLKNLTITAIDNKTIDKNIIPFDISLSAHPPFIQPLIVSIEPLQFNNEKSIESFRQLRISNQSFCPGPATFSFRKTQPCMFVYRFSHHAHHATTQHPLFHSHQPVYHASSRETYDRLVVDIAVWFAPVKHPKRMCCFAISVLFACASDGVVCSSV